MARTGDRHYLITCRAPRRQVGSTSFTRGQSFTLPITADVAAYKRDQAWDVKIVPGVRGKGDGGPAEPPAAVPVKAQAAFTGLVNRLAAARDDADRLTPEELAGLRAQVGGGLRPIAELLAQVFGGKVRFWMAVLRLAPRALEWAVDKIEELADRDGEEEEPEPSTARADRLAATVKVPSPEEIRAAARELAAEDADGPEADPEDLDGDGGDRGADADEADPDAEAEAQGAGPAEPMAALQAAVLALQEGSEGVTMARALEFARAAGLAVTPELARIRKRDSLAAAHAELIAQAAPPAPASPSPTELEG